MAEKLQLQAEKRDITGKKVASLRREGFVPAVLYGKGFEPVSLKVDQKAFEKVYETAGESSIVNLALGSETHPVVIHDVSTDPVTDVVIHTDFHKVNLDEKIRVPVELEFTGESEAVKNLSGVLVTAMHEVEVEALPLELPQRITVDISALKTFEDRITIADLAVSGNVKFLDEADAVVAFVQEPREEEAEETETSIEDVEVATKEGAPAGEEGEEAAQEGEKPAAADEK